MRLAECARRTKPDGAKTTLGNQAPSRSWTPAVASLRSSCSFSWTGACSLTNYNSTTSVLTPEGPDQLPSSPLSSSVDRNLPFLPSRSWLSHLDRPIPFESDADIKGEVALVLFVRRHHRVLFRLQLLHLSIAIRELPRTITTDLCRCCTGTPSRSNKTFHVCVQDRCQLTLLSRQSGSSAYLSHSHPHCRFPPPIPIFSHTLPPLPPPFLDSPFDFIPFDIVLDQVDLSHACILA